MNEKQGISMGVFTGKKNSGSTFKVEMGFEPESNSLLIVGLNLKILSRFFNFSDGSWHACAHGVADDNLELISSPYVFRPPLPTLPEAALNSDNISPDARKFPFKQITLKALQEWGFKDAWLETDTDDPHDTIGWNDIPRDPAFKTLSLHDDYFISFLSRDLSAIKQLAVFTVNECASFLYPKPGQFLPPESVSLIHKLITNAETQNQLMVITADKKNLQLTCAYKVKSKSWLKRLLGIKDVVKVKIKSFI